MFKKFEEFINEDFNRSEEIAGLKLVDRISTEDFMEDIKNKTIDNSLIYRLVDYQPKPDKWVYDTSEPHEVFRPVYYKHTTYLKGGTKFSTWSPETTPMTDVDIDWKGKEFSKSMFTSPFVIFPSRYREIEDRYVKAGKYYMRYGKITRDYEEVVTGSHIGFMGLSLSSLVKNLDFLELENDLDLNVLLGEDNEKNLGISLKKFARNYIGYDFAGVLAYTVEDSATAIESIEVENQATDNLGKFRRTSEL
jgi:hypothetical protein